MSDIICTADNNACQNGGSCIVNADPALNVCDCPSNTRGNRCHTVVADAPPTEIICTADNNACQNGGTCIVNADPALNVCDCPSNTRGNRCHTVLTGEDISVCTPGGSECLNGGTCIESTEVVDGKTVAANKCSCPLDTFGEICLTQEEKDEAAAAAAEAAAAEQAVSTQVDPICTKNGNECQNGGFCVFATEDGNIPENYCVCPDTHTGNRCHGTKPGASTSTSTDTTPVKKGSSCDTAGGCANGGVCVLGTDQTDGSASNYCACPQGFSGDMCEQVDKCSLDCQHGSSCRHHDDVTHGNDGGSDYCECVGNYKGKECEIPVETCPTPAAASAEPLECLWGGTCVDNEGDWICECPAGRSGDSCEAGADSTIDDYNGPCYQDSECQNEGLCVRSHDAEESAKTGMNSKITQCLCPLGFGGDNCEHRCESLNCQHGSSCRFHSGEEISHANDSPDNGAFCDCTDLSFKGKECEIAFVKCPDGLECLYGGSCIGSESDEDANVYSCACPAGFTGTQCEIRDQSISSGSGLNTGGSNTGGFKQRLATDVNIFVVTVCVVVFLCFVPAVLFVLKRRRDKIRAELAVGGLELKEFDAEFEATTESNGNGTDSGVEEELFDYDGDGVVNVDLNDSEPVPLPKDKQIV